jgi:hypothetical protein
MSEILVLNLFMQDETLDLMNVSNEIQNVFIIQVLEFIWIFP